ncbi:hypothetical protein D3C72_1548910 [compost metagenome]
MYALGYQLINNVVQMDLLVTGGRPAEVLDLLGYHHKDLGTVDRLVIARSGDKTKNVILQILIETTESSVVRIALLHQQFVYRFIMRRVYSQTTVLPETIADTDGAITAVDQYCKARQVFTAQPVSQTVNGVISFLDLSFRGLRMGSVD